MSESLTPDQVVPKASIQRVHHRDGDRFLVFRFELDPAKRELMSVTDSLEKANDLVRFDPPPDEGLPHRGNYPGA
ncbi:hypothetical protein GCM10027568_10950 [Humibacter soli]